MCTHTNTHVVLREVGYALGDNDNDNTNDNDSDSNTYYDY